MMFSEFIERTGFSESYITYKMYTDFIEPCYTDAPLFVNKDMFCEYFRKTYDQTVGTLVSGLISAHSTDDLIDFVNGDLALTDVESANTELLTVFLDSFKGLSKSHWRDVKIKRDKKSA